MKIRNILLSACLAAGASASAQDNTITVETAKLGAPVQPTMYGIFFEDINYAADGGLYAELVMNRSFEFPNPFAGWDISGKVSLQNDGPFEKNPRYVRLAPSGHAHKHTMIENSGFFGMGIKKGAEYKFSVWARCPEGGNSKIWVDLVDNATMGDDQKIGNGGVEIQGKEWKKYTLTIKASKTVEKAHMRVWGDSKVTTDLEHVSLFPVDTYMGDENGMRKDLAQALYDMKPGVFRFPGGCIVEGTDLESRYQWKNSVGPVENRPLNENRWHYTFTNRYYPNYFQSYGLGFFEYFRLSEQIGAEPLPVLNVGMACQYQNEIRDEKKVHVGMDDLKPYIDDCIDLIEFANGDPAKNQWAKLRADMGHPAPFNLKFIGVGNEQWDYKDNKAFSKRLKVFVEAIRKAHPEIKIIGTSGPDSEGQSFDLGWTAMKELKADLVDEHFYRNIDWFKNEMNRYDEYDRTGPKVFAGEYACHDRGKKWNHAGASIYEAAFMTNLEKNADVVHMATYAPLFAHVEGWQWRPDAIWFDNLRSAKTVSYYVQALYAQNKGTNVLSTTIANPTPKGQDGIFASAVYDKESNEVIVKVINTTEGSKSIDIKLNGLKNGIAKVNTITLDCSDYDMENTVDNPNAIVPQEATLKAEGSTIKANVAGKNFVVFKIKK
ncbi:MAG: carbohydrate binding domain-containing protein [Bacteroidaceae bacterium]|nr:carbohydrate binding domain-containing protein [Bacteroidaceae bacterium]